MIFVAPKWQRRGVATALAAAAVSALADSAAHRTLVSRYHLGNEASGAWHHRFGFADETDLMLAQLRLRAATHELARQSGPGTLTRDLECEFKQARGHWQREVQRLEAIVTQGHDEETYPWRKWRRKE